MVKISSWICVDACNNISISLCRAVADTLDLRFNPVSVQGEISGFARAASGHCYFSLKDEGGQIRCAMFRRAAGALDFSPRDGEQVQVQGRLGVYEARGDLQLVVESMQRAGQGALYEQFLRLKARLEAEGLFDAERKRPLPEQPRAIGVVTSPGAAAWHGVMTALQRRVPHIPVRLAPAQVQGQGAAATLVQALQQVYAWTAEDHPSEPPIDVILLVRGGGSLEDLWCFNDEQLARMLAQSPVPVISGVAAGPRIDLMIVGSVPTDVTIQVGLKPTLAEVPSRLAVAWVMPKNTTSWQPAAFIFTTCAANGCATVAAA